MSVKTVLVRQCDKCAKIIEGRLTIHTCPCCHKDICVECQEKEDARHKPRERKPKSEPALPSVDEAIKELVDLVSPSKKTSKQRDKTKETPEIADKKGGNLPDISAFSVSIGLGNQPNTLKLGEAFVSALTLREGITELFNILGIDQKYVEDAPDSEGKRNLLGILKEG